MVISSTLSIHQEDGLIGILRSCKKAIGWKFSDLKGISPLVCTHHIYMVEEAKPFRQPQRRLNPHMQEVVRVGVVELLNANTNCTFKVNGQSLKPFVEYFSRDKEEFILLNPPQA